MLQLIQRIFSVGVVGPLAALGGAIGLLWPRTYRGRLMWTLFLYGISGLFIAVMAIWWSSSVYDRYFAHSAKITLGEIEVIGAADATAGDLLKKVMPGMLVAELATLKTKAKTALIALGEADSAASATPTTQDFRYADIPVQFELFNVPDINLKIGETDVSSLVKWLFESAAEESRLKLTVVMGDEARKTRIFGFVPARDDRAFAIDSTHEPYAVVHSIASTILQQQAAQGRDEIGQLSSADFETFIDALSKYAAAERARTVYGTGKQEDYEEVLGKIAPLADRAKGWLDLQWITALISERAGQPVKAAGYYTNIRTSDRIEASVASWLEKKIDSLQEPAPTHDGNEFVARRLSDEEAKTVWSLLGIDRRGSAADVAIGVVGPPPDDKLLAEIRSEVLTTPSTAKSTDDIQLKDYVTSLVQVIRLVCEDNKYVFTGNNTFSDLVAGLETFAAANRADIVLFTYAARGGDKAINSALTKLAQNSLVVVAAGNSGADEPSPYAALADQIAVVGALNGKGEQPAEYSAVGPGLIWAPGDNIPLPGSGPAQVAGRSGTSYSASIVAGVAATLKADFPKATPAQLLQALKESQKRPDGQPGSIKPEKARETLKTLLQGA